MNSRKLDVHQFTVRISPLAATFADSLPPRYAGLADQLRRVPLSVPLNIMEGSGNNKRPDQRRFYAEVRGSAMECAAILDAGTVPALVEKRRAEEVGHYFSHP